MPAFRRFLLALLCISLAAACTRQNQSQPVTLTVMAAASLTDAFTEIGQLFEQQNPETRVEFTFAGSQQLAQQLSQGAPADLFASANSAQMDVLVESGRVEAGSVRIFARNRLVVIVPRENHARIHDFADLRKPGIRLVLAAGEVPAGKYTLEALQKANEQNVFGPSFQQEVLANVVSYENNVRIVLAKVQLGEADAGIVYTSDAVGKPAESIIQVPIPEAYNATAEYPIAAMNDSPRDPQAQAFLYMVLSEQGQAVLTKYGFLPSVKQSAPEEQAAPAEQSALARQAALICSDFLPCSVLGGKMKAIHVPVAQWIER